MATMPSRIDTLRVALPGILAQVDRLYLYLDKQVKIPQELASIPKLVCILPTSGERVLGTSGKFLALKAYREPCLFFTFDDDILYAQDYVKVLSAALRRHHYRAIVGLHGAIYRQPLASYVRDREVIHFRKALGFDSHVDELGTGVLAFHSSLVDIDLARWAHPNMADLHLMLDAVRQEIPRICVRRRQEQATPLEQHQPDSLFMQSLRDDSVETALLRDAFRHYPGRWCMSS
ncbi:hypothetical protein [Caenimonas koreensis]|uniref:Glycosyl transferase family 2 n=1 Tax=Caenimonas koreensis DSM 17982 TaxID=1121255 RepID=A0A844AU55_9BURK|nr:hypothetical protein [Caenimonas koreensis]MRD47644.1 hypothetical protein [Caenimonas koreensis DSM 17982]